MSSNPNPSSMVGRDELAALLGASHASDMVAAASTDVSKGTSLSSMIAGGGRRSGGAKNGDEDVSKMDRAQAAALVARQFGGSVGAGWGSGTAVGRHRATGKRKRMMQHHLLADDFLEKAVNSAKEDVNEFYGGKKNSQKNDEDEDESFSIRADAGASSGRRKNSEAKVLLRRRGDEGSNNGRRRQHSSSSESESDKSSNSSSGNSTRSRVRRGGSGGRNRRRRSSSASPWSASEDEADRRRQRARERARIHKNKKGGSVQSEEESPEDTTHSKTKVKKRDRSQSEELNANEIVGRPKEKSTSNGFVEKNSEGNEGMQKSLKKESESRQKQLSRSPLSGSSSTSSTSEDCSTSSSSSSDSSSDEDKYGSVSLMVAKPLFVPKSKRGTVSEVELQQQKMEDAEVRRAKEKEKRVLQSRALVAEAVSAAGKDGTASSSGIGGADEFDVGEGGDFITVPDDNDPTEHDSPEKVLAERDAWEVRELIRILRDVDEAAAAEKELQELERRRAMTDEERLTEDRKTGRYRAPGEARRGQEDGRKRQRKNSERSENKYLQRYHHRGAFYMDEDTLENAGKDDVRHRAAAYSRAATGEDKFDKSALPEVMQVKKFGFAGYSTKYKGLAKEDTTDKKMFFLPVGGNTSAKRAEDRRRRW